MNGEQILAEAVSAASLFDNFFQCSNRSALCAHERSGLSLHKLNQHCAAFASGAVSDRSSYEALSRSAHIAGFELLTYGEICASLGIRPPVDCAEIVEAALAIQSRALDQEALFLSAALSPGVVFYDDLYSVDRLNTEGWDGRMGTRHLAESASHPEENLVVPQTTELTDYSQSMGHVGS